MPRRTPRSPARVVHNSSSGFCPLATHAPRDLHHLLGLPPDGSNAPKDLIDPCPTCHDLIEGSLASLYPPAVLRDIRAEAVAEDCELNAIRQAMQANDVQGAARLLVDGPITQRLLRHARYSELLAMVEWVNLDSTDLEEPLARQLMLLRGGVRRWKGDYREALHWLRRAERDDVLPDRDGRLVLRTTGETLSYIPGRLASARECYEEAVRTARDVGDSKEEIMARSGLAAAHVSAGNADLAFSEAERGLALSRKVDDAEGINEHLERQIAVRLQEHRAESALPDVGTGLIFAASGNRRRPLAYRFRRLGEVYTLLDEPERALASLSMARVIAAEFSDPNWHLLLNAQLQLSRSLGEARFARTKKIVNREFRRFLREAVDATLPRPA